MFKNSGMNYFIGEWDFKSMINDPGRINVFFFNVRCNEL